MNYTKTPADLQKLQTYLQSRPANTPETYIIFLHHGRDVKPHLASLAQQPGLVIDTVFEDTDMVVVKSTPTSIQNLLGNAGFMLDIASISDDQHQLSMLA